MSRLAAKLALNRNIARIDQRNVRTRSSAGSMTGAGCREERQAKGRRRDRRQCERNPVRPAVQPHSWLLTRPSASRPAAAATSPAPRRSGTAASSSTGSSRTTRAAATKISDADRHVDEEHPAPGQLGQQAADGGPDRGCDRAHRRPHAYSDETPVRG